MANTTSSAPEAIFLTTNTFEPLPPLLPFISDIHLLLILPTIAYWAYGIFFFWIDKNDYFTKYRLHTPTEVLKRNKIPMAEVIRSILFYQLVTTLLGFWLMRGQAPDSRRREDIEIAVWVFRIRELRKSVPIGLMRALAAAGGLSVSFRSMGATRDPYVIAPTWEIAAAKAMRWFVVPASQYVFAIFIADTWQYFEHRVVHMNQYLYTNFHSVHHRIYIPYAFGAFYSNIYEQFIVDVLGTYLAINLPGLSTRQALYFTTLSTLKAAHDHCGYSMPWHPFEWLTDQNAFYHDIHHQGWGIKTNYSQLYTTFWDRVMGTMWAGDAEALAKRYEGVTEVDVAKKWSTGVGGMRKGKKG